MNIAQYVAPTFEPISLTELKLHLKIDSGTLSDAITFNACILSGPHPVVTAYTLLGAAIEVIGKQAIVYLQPVDNGTAATVDCKIQDSDDTTTWADWVGGAFTQVTEANDTVIQEKQYTGSKRYIRTVAKTLVQACTFGTSVLVQDAYSIEDALLTSILQAAREQVEDITRRYIITQTLDYSIDDWPCEDRIKLPGGNLQSITSIKYTNSAGTVTTMTPTTDYLIETCGDQCGYVVLPYQGVWPTAVLYPVNPITIRYVAGWTTAELVPSKIKTAIKFAAEELYNHGARQSNTYSEKGQSSGLEKIVQTLVYSSKLWDDFDDD